MIVSSKLFPKTKSFEGFVNLTAHVLCNLELGTTKKPFRLLQGLRVFRRVCVPAAEKKHISRFFAAHATSYPCMQNATGAGRIEVGFLGTATCWKSWLHG